MNIHAHNAATASYSDKGVQGSAKAFSRKTRALRESLSAEGPSQLNQDINRSMEQILREEEEERE